ncbi:MAG: helix-turn-helix transcriptional regulator [Flavobacteriales bacterium]|jgi:DNA-binding XRE family transcriptional regulator|nr:helix-turn-helix transcriptional regulator [Flavobacteriales bacterium]MBL6841441.1 helix-turn-helix transcriptional regulator [Pelagibacterales bacterium]
MLVNRVKDFRKGINLTQEELASKASVSRQTIISIEKNKFVPGLDVAMKISKSLNTPIDKLFYFV